MSTPIFSEMPWFGFKSKGFALSSSKVGSEEEAEVVTSTT